MSSTTNTNEPMDTEPGGENTQYESQKVFTATSAQNKEDASGKADTSRVHRDDDGEGNVRSSAHGKEQHQERGVTGEGNAADKYRDDEGRVHLPTHNVVKPADIAARAKKAEEEKEELRERGKAGYGGGSGVGA